MAYPDIYGPDEHRRALNAMLADMFALPGRQAPLPIESYLGVGRSMGSRAPGVGQREVPGPAEVRLPMRQQAPALKLA